MISKKLNRGYIFTASVSQPVLLQEQFFQHSRDKFGAGWQSLHRNQLFGCWLDRYYCHHRHDNGYFGCAGL